MSTATGVLVQRDAPLPTWYRVGGRADALVKPETIDELRAALEAEGPVRVLGEGANLLVDDDGVDGLVVSLGSGVFKEVRIDPVSHLVHAGAGVDLRRLITLTSNAGLAGLETLGGIPATVGGAVRMNAGGAFGQISQTVARVRVMDRGGREKTLHAAEIDFGYRHSSLSDVMVIEAAFSLVQEEPRAVRDRLRECMAYKKRTQPMAERSAGCAFKNPMLIETIEGVGSAGNRASAGKLIDLAGCKGMRIGGARVSVQHANFLTAEEGAKARDLLELMGQVQECVREKFGVLLEREVVVWRRGA